VFTYTRPTKVTTGYLYTNDLQVLIEFGGYFVIKKNCQLFCTLYLKELGLGERVLQEDTDKAIAASLVVVAVIAIVIAYKRSA